MTSGGSRNRSGPQKDPRSARSDSKNLSYVLLPSGGFTGRLPAWPLSKATAQERDVWKWAWRTPQAAQWAKEPWRLRTVAMWVRWSVRAEDPECAAADVAASMRFADQIGLTPAGLKENGWQVSVDEVGAARESKTSKPEKAAPVRRLRSVSSDGA